MINWLHNLCPWLRGCERDVFSQFGEDGLVDAIFDRIGTTNKVAFECGCNDGVFYSNTARLCMRGWMCYLADSDQASVDKCKTIRPHDVIECATVGPCGEPLDDLLARMGCPSDMDLCIIDIDGQDWWVVHDMQATPRVLMVEYQCPNLDGPPPMRGETACIQAGSSAIRELLDSKGYTVIVRTDCNAIAVRNDLFEKLSTPTG